MQNGLNKRVLWKKVLFFILLLPAIVIVFLILKNSTYLISEFILVPNNTSQFEQCDKMESIGQKSIPKIIHQVHGFKDLQMSQDHLDKIKNWREQHSDYVYYLWNATTVNRLIQTHYKHLHHLFTSYGSWIQRADVARYVILNHHGGWYIDLDVRCKAGLQDLVLHAYFEKKTGIFHTTYPAGISNDIFGITPRHPFLNSVLDNLPNANRWYLLPHWNILLSAGSTYMWGRLLNYPCKENLIVLEKDEYEKYFQIEHDGSWHSWDDKVGLMLLHVLQYKSLLTTFMVLFCLIVVVCVRLTCRSKHLTQVVSIFLHCILKIYG